MQKFPPFCASFSKTTKQPTLKAKQTKDNSTMNLLEPTPRNYNFTAAPTFDFNAIKPSPVRLVAKTQSKIVLRQVSLITYLVLASVLPVVIQLPSAEGKRERRRRRRDSHLQNVGRDYRAKRRFGYVATHASPPPRRAEMEAVAGETEGGRGHLEEMPGDAYIKVYIRRKP